VALAWVSGAVAAPSDCPDVTLQDVNSARLEEILQAHERWLDEGAGGGHGRADLTGAKLERRDLRNRRFTKAILTGARLDGTDLRGARLEEARLDCAWLINAKLGEVRARDARFVNTRLQWADFEAANLWAADFTGATLWETNFNKADLDRAILRHVRAERTGFAGSLMYGVDLTGAIFRPVSAPGPGHVSTLKGLDTVVIDAGDYGGATQLRASLRASGLAGLEREITYSIESWRTRELLAQWRTDPIGHALSLVHAGLRTLAFGVTTQYGLNPPRALWWLLVVWGLAAFVYTGVVGATNRAGRRGALVQFLPERRVVRTGAGFVTSSESEVSTLRRSGLGALGWGAYFSLLSTFQIGYREVQAGGWLRGLQPREFEIRAWGWVRVVAGLQSLICLYLVVIWLLTQFGRIFE
jgi:uncharacterized protein YjbI with pentapeptide repeats